MTTSRSKTSPAANQKASARTSRASSRKKTRRERKSKGLAIFLATAVFFYILSSSIAFPILCKPFYYAQIEDLELVKNTGLTEEQIKTAYSEMVNFCIGVQEDFSVGDLSYSEEGKDHFADCRELFILDLGILALSSLALIVWLLIRPAVSMRAIRPHGHGPGFFGALILLISFAVIGGLGAIDFDKTFVIFHSVFFPGKSNWLFDPRVDEVINILPETFFMRCALVIVGLILIQSLIFLMGDRIRRKKLK